MPPTHGVTMLQLPLKTNIPLDVLNARIDETFFNISVRNANCLQNAGITRNWQLLVQHEASMLGIKNFGRKSLRKVKEMLAEKGWKFGMFWPHIEAGVGLHANMTIDELFVYIPTERPPLTEEQVAFLGQWPRDVFTAADELAWWHMHVSNTVRNRVFNIAVLLPHLRSDDEHKETIARIRARIEAEVGPLPLALSSDELRNFFR